MDRLHFGARARRRARLSRRLKRLQAAAVMLGVTGILIGVPGSRAGFDLFEHLAARHGLHPVEADGLETTEAAAAAMHFRHRVFGSRPEPTPTPTPTDSEAESSSGETEVQLAGYSGSVSDIIRAAAAEFGVSGDHLVSVASCESALNPGAHNPAGYYGLFQFDQQTWGAYGYGSIWDPVAQSRTAARLIAAGQASRWPNCA